jgi:hypothetical protein
MKENKTVKQNLGNSEIPVDAWLFPEREITFFMGRINGATKYNYDPCHAMFTI